MPRNLLFENVTCSRCGGSGKFSWCQSYGDTCFKCHGDGKTLTKRGRAAQNWLTAQKKKKGREIEVGMTVLAEGIPGFTASRWFKVEAVTGEGTEHKIDGVDKHGERHGFQGFWDVGIRVAQTKERLAELRDAALAFQAELTKTGTVRKRKMKEAA